MRIVSYNVHAAVGIDGMRSEQRVAEVLAECAPDVVALQELDCARRRSKGVDQAACIAAWLEMESHFHPAYEFRTEKFGDAILSRHPMRLVRAGALPGRSCWPPGERRGALWVEIQAEGALWQVFNTHFGLGRSERQVQAKALAGPDWVGRTTPESPTVICGDFNSPPGGVVHGYLSARWREVVPVDPGKTFPSRYPLVRLDHFFARGRIELRGAHVHQSALSRVASDHLPLVAEFAPAPGP